MQENNTLEPISQTNDNANVVISDSQLSKTHRDSRRRRKHLSSDTKNNIASFFILLLAPVIAVLLTMFVFQSYQVDGPSMRDTLQDADRLIVWKLPRTWASITGDQYIPNRGDIIIFKEPGMGNYNEPDGSKQLVKRVIGLPGDRVVIKGGLITIYNSSYPDGYIPDQELPYAKAGALIAPSNEDWDVTLTSTQLFVCGDNRNNSTDSRYFGPIETSQVVGKLAIRIFPLNQAKVF